MPGGLRSDRRRRTFSGGVRVPHPVQRSFRAICASRSSACISQGAWGRTGAGLEEGLEVGEDSAQPMAAASRSPSPGMAGVGDREFDDVVEGLDHERHDDGSPAQSCCGASKVMVRRRGGSLSRTVPMTSAMPEPSRSLVCPAGPDLPVRAVRVAPVRRGHLGVRQALARLAPPWP